MVGLEKPEVRGQPQISLSLSLSLGVQDQHRLGTSAAAAAVALALLFLAAAWDGCGRTAPPAAQPLNSPQLCCAARRQGKQMDLI